MQMQVGEFRFDVDEAEYQELLRTRTRRWEQRDRHGRPQELEDLGRDAERISLTGTVWVQDSADLAALDALAEEAGLMPGSTGRALPVFLGGGRGSSGEYLGRWTVPRLEITERALRGPDGIPTRIDFEVELLEMVDT